jgi:hypothetical protein
MNHAVMIGDSIFDNGAYVEPSQPDVIQQVRAMLPQGWRATLRAVDGATTRDVEGQLQGLPADATNLVISVGGNDALHGAHVLLESARSVADALGKLAAVRERFEFEYRAMLDTILERGLPTAICTIYDGYVGMEEQQRINVAALAIFNDVIIREAFARGLALIDLRIICTAPEDYSNPIEPSANGGEKIAAAIVGAVTGGHNFARSQVYTHQPNCA